MPSTKRESPALKIISGTSSPEHFVRICSLAKQRHWHVLEVPINEFLAGHSSEPGATDSARTLIPAEKGYTRFSSPETADLLEKRIEASAKVAALSLLSNDQDLNASRGLNAIACRMPNFMFFTIPAGRGLLDGIDLHLPAADGDYQASPERASGFQHVLVDQRVCLDRLGIGTLMSIALWFFEINIEHLTLEASGSLAIISLKARLPKLDSHADLRWDSYDIKSYPKRDEDEVACVEWSVERLNSFAKKLKSELDRIAPPLSGPLILDESTTELEMRRGPRPTLVDVGWWKWHEIPFTPGILAGVLSPMTIEGMRIRRIEVQTLFLPSRQPLQNIEVTVDIPRHKMSDIDRMRQSVVDATSQFTEHVPTFKHLGHSRRTGRDRRSTR
jgi:hypothetical protein